MIYILHIPNLPVLNGFKKTFTSLQKDPICWPICNSQYLFSLPILLVHVCLHNLSIYRHLRQTGLHDNRIFIVLWEMQADASSETTASVHAISKAFIQHPLYLHCAVLCSTAFVFKQVLWGYMLCTFMGEHVWSVLPNCSLSNILNKEFTNSVILAVQFVPRMPSLSVFQVLGFQQDPFGPPPSPTVFCLLVSIYVIMHTILCLFPRLFYIIILSFLLSYSVNYTQDLVRVCNSHYKNTEFHSLLLLNSIKLTKPFFIMDMWVYLYR